MEWCSTLMAQLRDSFFSLGQKEIDDYLLKACSPINRTGSHYKNVKHINIIHHGVVQHLDGAVTRQLLLPGAERGKANTHLSGATNDNNI